MKNIILSLVLGAALVGCASMPSATEQQAADYGMPISQVDAEAAAKAYLASRLKDPMSAVITWSAVEKGFVGSAPLLGRKAAYGYLLNGSVNAKNSFGGYTGAKPYQFLFRNGVVVYAAKSECLDVGSCYMAPF